MNKTLVPLIAFLVVSCSSGPSIQEYFVSKSEDASFLIIDIPTSIFGIDKSTLTVEEQELFTSFKKLNLLIFKKTDSNAALMDRELTAVRSIIDGKNFESLMVFSDKSYSGKLVMQGDEERPNEIVLFASSDEGFLVTRLLGKKMQVDKALLLADIIQREKGVDQLERMFSEFF